jgi:hypothetical protein
MAHNFVFGGGTQYDESNHLPRYAAWRNKEAIHNGWLPSRRPILMELFGQVRQSDLP